MKLLLISPLPPPVGGIASWSVNILKYLSNKPDGFKFLHQNSAISGRRITKYNAVTRIFFGVKESRAVIKKLKENIRIFKPDIIHLTSSASFALIKDFYILQLARKYGIPLITHWRFGRIPDLAKRRNWEWYLLLHIIKKSYLSIIIDEKSYRTLHGLGFKNVLNIPNPISIDLEQKAKRVSLKARIRHKGRLLYVGHVTKGKGVFELVEACTQISEVEELLLIGPYEENVKTKLLKIAWAKDDGLWLKMYGTIESEKVLSLMNRSAILVLPSYTEGFPNVVIEAMGMGCGVIASDVGAIPEMLDVTSENPCGICVPAKNIELLKEAIELVIKNPDAAQSMGTNGVNRVLSNYTIEKVVKQYKSAWENAVCSSKMKSELF